MKATSRQEQSMASRRRWCENCRDLIENIRAGKADTQSDAVKRLTGQKPQTLGEFLMAHKCALAL
jgi:hypothetical protein